MVKREILLLVLLVIAIIAIVKVAEMFKTPMAEADATKFVLEDLRAKYLGADAEIINVRPLTNSAGEKYFEIKAKVTKQQGTPCPERMHIFYNYPVQNFVPQPPEVITSNCQVCTTPSCILVFPEEAVIASHTFVGTEEVSQYISSFPNAKPNAAEISSGWTVTWNSGNATYYYLVNVLKNNSIGQVKRVGK
ncbi:MAG: hypothetical protein V1492_03180 [Candidatus Micrarchaeota archaeon]